MSGRAAATAVSQKLVRLAAAGGVLLLGLELLGLRGMPAPRRIAALFAAWALFMVILPSLVRRRRRRHTNRRSPAIWDQRLGLALAGLAGAFLALETAATTLFPDFPLEIQPDPDSPVPLVQKDAQLRGRFTPGFHGRFLRWPYRGVAVRINDNGFRDRPWDRPRHRLDRPTRLLAVGDSFTFGTGVPEEATYLRELERLMGQEILTFNAAVPGFGPIDESFVLRRHLEEIAPSLVIVGLYTGNDLDDVVLATDRLARPLPGTDTAASSRKTRPSAERRTRRAHLPRIFVTLGRADYWLHTCRICALAAPSLSGWAARLGIGAAADAKSSLLLRACSRAPDPEVERVIRIIVDTLEDASDYCRWRGARLAVVLIPLREFVEPGAFERVLGRLSGVPPEDLSPDVLHDRLRTRIEERGLPVLDLLPQLRSRAAEGAELFVPDGHLNESGHREVARALARFLRTAMRAEAGTEGTLPSSGPTPARPST